MTRLKQTLYRQIWPKEDIGLLLEATFLPVADATSCWSKWKSHRDIDSITWEEHKIFARLASRIATIAPECSYRPRLEGLSKAHWTQSQLMLRASSRALDIMINNNIPVMLLKGGALHTLSQTANGPRITSDLDVLVMRSDFPRAIQVLYEAGWTSKDSVEFSSSRWRFASGTNLRLRPHGDIDVHHQPVHGDRVSDKILELLWQRSQRTVFHGKPVQVPTSADLLVFAASHAVHAQGSKEPSATWVFDLMMLIRCPDFDPAQVVRSASDFNAIPATLATLSYVQQLQPDPIVGNVINLLQKHTAGWDAWLRYYLESLKRPHGKLIRSLAQRLLPYTAMENELDVVPRIRPHWFSCRAKNKVALGAGCKTARLRHEVELPPALSAGQRLTFKIAFIPAAKRRYQFDIAIDGLAVARLSVYPRKAKATAEDFAFSLPLNKGHRASIESLAKFSLHANPSTRQIEEAKPVEFQLLELSHQ